MRPGPAVVAAPPAAVVEGADGAVRTDVVGEQPAARARTPAVDVPANPRGRLLVTVVEPAVRGEGGRGEVHGDVARRAALHLLRHPLGVGGVGEVVPGGDAVQAVQRQTVRAHLVPVGGVRHDLLVETLARTQSAVVRRADHVALGVVVALCGVGEEGREPGGARGERGVGRVGGADAGEEQQRLALMEPVVAVVVLLGEHARLGELHGHALPVPLGVGEHLVGAAEQVERGPVEEGLVQVVHAVAVDELRDAAEAAVRQRVAVAEEAAGLLDLGEEPALQHGPGRDRTQRTGERGLRHGHPFVAPATRPPMMWRCITMKNTIAGSTASRRVGNTCV